MKKAVGLLAVVLGLALVQPAQAVDQKALVVIDSYFDSRAVNGNVSCIVVATNVPCTDVVKTFPTSLSDNINHGNAMIEVAKRQNADIKIIALRSAATPSSDVNAGTFIDALKWVDKNSSIIGAVSLSRFFNGTKPCSPASVNTAPYGGVTGADKQIKDLIALLNNKGIRVFTSTGNAPKTTVDYPACITSTMAVTSAGNAQDINTDFSAELVRLPLLGNNFYSSLFKAIPLTTSSATASTAAQWVLSGTLTSKTAKVLA
jgi:hypothetical protein